MASKRGMISRLPVLSMSRKSQLTAFMLIGILMLAIFGFLYFISNQSVTSDTDTRLEEAEEAIRDTNILRQYITLCLRDNLKEALILAGQQGGRIEPPAEYAELDGNMIGYGITQKQFDREYPGPPAYPCVNAPATTSYPCSSNPNNLLSPKKFFPFGEINLTPLCDPDGLNSPAGGGRPCPTGTYGENSIQERIKGFIEANIGECINLTPLEQSTGFGIENGSPNVSVLFGEEEVIARITYPLNVTFGTESSIQLFNYQTSLPVRLKKVYGLAYYIASLDTYDLEFSPEEDFSDYLYFNRPVLPPMNVSQYPADSGGTIIQVNDSASMIEGSIYTFRFAVANRHPALDPVPDASVNEDQTITISTAAYDPDDNDMLSWDVTGWKDGSWSASGGSISVSTAADDAGNHEITVHVCDGSGACDSQDVEIEVNSIA
ncbi:hypothetical protein GF345_00390 [Candidatus Woesearchaeota archaeon]|nr:hypothetical protein [Candidatus Woesearchaeota archaeon]